MEPSNFLEWVKRYMPGIVIRVTQTLNDENRQPTYLHKRMLRKVFSVSGKWEALSVNGQLVAADFVAMDSSLPLKKRPTYGKASGEIPKQGLEFHLNEQQLTDLDTLIALGTANEVIVARLFQDVPNAIGAIYEKNEGAFLQGLSSGVTVVQDDKNTGTGIRLDFKYLAGNKFTSAIPFSDPASQPFDQLKSLLDKATADGYPITTFFTDPATIQNIAKTNQAKEIYGFFAGFAGQNIPTPSLSRLNEATKDRFGFVFEVVDRTIRTQKNGVNTSYKPWQAGMMIGVNTDQVGELQWATLAEDNHRVAGVEYQKADDYILVSQYRVNKPSLGEVTAAQARAVPVISGVEQIFQFDSTVDATPEG